MNGQEQGWAFHIGAAERLHWERLLGDRIETVQPFQKNWLVTTAHGRWVAKRTRRPGFLQWWAGVDREIRLRGFQQLPFWLTDGREWQLSAWIPGRSARYRQQGDLVHAAAILGRFHRLGRGLYTPTLSPGSNLIKRVEERFLTFIRFVRKQNSPAVQQVLQPVEGELLQCGQQVLEALSRFPWDDWCRREQQMHNLVHRDLASHNWIWDSVGRGWLIDFDTAGYDVQVGDLWQLLSRGMWEQNWEPSILQRAVATYEQERPLQWWERELLRILLAFPNEIYREAIGLGRGDPEYTITRTLPYLERLVTNVPQWRPWTRQQSWLV
ncbi:phosphotransferase [Desmospora activa]|uniref:Phosphotransferase family enzyme n=1 Tax=Desmospora activa DSM 45169 TaxID=1121389 RepID=A0A2T4Z8U0_9BACL|nr:phosphotransferase [Desmospora activa]PTM58311.1 phosphotransferase family enzyme [Desmospora activa DSM 45169]